MLFNFTSHCSSKPRCATVSLLNQGRRYHHRYHCNVINISNIAIRSSSRRGNTNNNNFGIGKRDTIFHKNSSSCTNNGLEVQQQPIKQLRIVSRRAYNRKKLVNSKSNVNSNDKKTSSSAAGSSSGSSNSSTKDWPQSVRIIGYLLGFTAIPYSVTWFFVTNKDIRDVFLPFVPESAITMLRKHFGELEHNCISYYDSLYTSPEYMGDTKYYILEDEIPRRVRLQEDIINREILNTNNADNRDENNTIPTRLSLVLNDSVLMAEEQKINCNTIASNDALLSLMSTSLSKEDTTNKKELSIAVDFGDLPSSSSSMSGVSDPSSADTQNTAYDKIGASNVSYSDGGGGTMKNEEEKLMELMCNQQKPSTATSTSWTAMEYQHFAFSPTIYSPWYYQSPSTAIKQSSPDKHRQDLGRKKREKDSTSTNNTNQLLSDNEIEISKLEYEINQVKKDLSDVNCTRNHDDMESELSELYKRLNKLKRRRFMKRWRLA